MGGNIDSVQLMLDDIYQWFLANLKNKTPASSGPPQPDKSYPVAGHRDKPTFSLGAYLADITGHLLICPMAAFRFNTFNRTDQELFQCCCREDDHDAVLSRFGCKITPKDKIQ